MAGSCVTVLMATYNGDKYLEEQIDSILNQKGVSVNLIIRDDGSSDKTIDILEKYKNKGVLDWYTGSRLKTAYSFFDLLKKAPHSDYYAFSDQDDVWDSDKLIYAIKMLNEVSDKEYALYCCGARLVDKNLNLISIHRMDKERTNHARLFFANIAGNTIVMNHSLRNKIIYHIPNHLVMHDSYCVKLALCLGARIIIDSQPHLNYRQHGNNVIGMELNKKDKIKKFFSVINNKTISKQLNEILTLYHNDIDQEYVELIESMNRCDTSVVDRLKLAFNRSIDFNNFFYNLAFRIKVLINSF